MQPAMLARRASDGSHVPKKLQRFLLLSRAWSGGSHSLNYLAENNRVTIVLCDSPFTRQARTMLEPSSLCFLRFERLEEKIIDTLECTTFEPFLDERFHFGFDDEGHIIPHDHTKLRATRMPPTNPKTGSNTCCRPQRRSPRIASWSSHSKRSSARRRRWREG